MESAAATTTAVDAAVDEPVAVSVDESMSTANWEAVTGESCLGLREIALSLGHDALLEFQQSNPGAVGAFLTHPTGDSPRPTEITACLRVAEGEQRFFSTRCTGDSGKRASFCSHCGLVRKSLHPRVTRSRAPLATAGTKTLASRMRRGLLHEDYKAVREQNAKLGAELRRQAARIDRMVGLSAAGRGHPDDPVSMMHTKDRSEAQAALTCMRDAENVLDNDDNDIFSVVMPLNSLTRKIWDTSRSNLASQLRTRSKAGYRCVAISCIHSHLYSLGV